MITSGIKSLDILADTWQVRNKVGQGAFSQLFVGKNIIDESEPLVALKIANPGIDGSVIRWEAEVLKAFHNSCVPKFIYQGNHEGCDYVVMELLGGEDMSHLRDRIRATSGSGLISIQAASYLTQQMLKCIQIMHDKGYVHRDIKPGNFVRKTVDSTEFCIIDFGITKLYRDREGKIKPKREHSEFRGTTTYASPHSHRCEDLCPRDDLYSLMYVFLDFICGSLPWTIASKSRDKPTVHAMKEEFLDDPKKLIEWVSSTAQKIQLSHIATCKEYEQNFPISYQEQTLRILEHLKTLEYESTPDYNLIEQALVTMSEANGFKWTGGNNKFNTNMLQQEEKELIPRLSVFTARLRTLQKSIVTISDSNSTNTIHNISSSSSSSSSLLSENDNSMTSSVATFSTDTYRSTNISRKWKIIVDDLVKDVPIDLWSDEILNTVDTLVTKLGYFFEENLEENDSDWTYFVSLQRTIFQYLEQVERSRSQKKARLENR